jgi:hypothetical protein
MADTSSSSAIIIGAVGAIIGVFVTQIFSIINSYFTDKRKYNSEQRQTLLLRKISVGEEFYTLNGLAIQSFKKTLHYFETRDNLKTDGALKLLADSLKEKNEYLKKITDREKAHTAINLYYNIRGNFENSQEFENNYIELLTKIQDIDATVPDAVQFYIDLNTKLVTLLKNNITMMEADRRAIEKEVRKMLDDFFK